MLQLSLHGGHLKFGPLGLILLGEMAGHLQLILFVNFLITRSSSGSLLRAGHGVLLMSTEIGREAWYFSEMLVLKIWEHGMPIDGAKEMWERPWIQ
jgi:hypothetical protein